MSAVSCVVGRFEFACMCAFLSRSSSRYEIEPSTAITTLGKGIKEPYSFRDSEDDELIVQRSKQPFISSTRATVSMHWKIHRLINTLLAVVALLLISCNIVVRERHVVEISESELARSRSSVPPGADRLELPIGALFKRDHRQDCSISTVSCISARSNIALPSFGDGFHLWDIFGEDWETRQFSRSQPALLRGGPGAASIRWCGNDHLPHGVHKRPSIQSPDAHFSVDFIATSDGCSGVICIRRSAKLSTPRLRHDEDNAVSTLIQRVLRFGPDDFRIRLVGSEVVSHLVHFLNNSDYAFPFDLSQHGSYHFEAEHIYEHFLAFDEVLDGTIPMTRIHLLPTVEKKGSLGEIEGVQHHFPKFNLFHVHAIGDPSTKYLRKSKFRATKHCTWDQFTFRSDIGGTCSPQGSIKAHASQSDGTNACEAAASGGCFTLQCWKARGEISRRLSERRSLGQWVLSHHNQTFPRSASPSQMQQWPLHHVHFERTDPQAIYEYRLFQDTCSSPLVGFSPSGFTARVADTFAGVTPHIAFVGDSHLRVTFTHLRNFLLSNTTCPLEDHMVKSMSSRLCKLSLQDHQRITMSLHNDVLLEDFITSSAKDILADVIPSVIVLGMGSWALGGKGVDPTSVSRAPADYGRWSLSKYKQVVLQVCAVLVELMQQRPWLRVVWMTIPAYPPNTRRFAKLKGEHRTNPRIYSFNEAAMDAFSSCVTGDLAHRFRVVDTFDITYPMMHLSLDHNHHTTYAQDAVLQVLLNAML